MKIISTSFPEVRIIEPTVYQDHRGYFMESFQADRFRENGLEYRFVQDNHAMSLEAGTIRGLHYQAEPNAQTKLVRVTSGAVYDVVVDIRPGSETIGKCIAVILSAENMRQLLVPKGFAHGYCTLVPNTQVQYKVDEYYSSEHNLGIAWDDPDLGIVWPFAKPVLSEKDLLHPRFREILPMNKNEVSAT